MKTRRFAVSLLLVFAFLALANAGQANAIGATITKISCTSTTMVVGQTVSCTAAVTPGLPTGTLTWSTTPTGTGTFSPASCTLTGSQNCQANFTSSSTALTAI